MISGNLKVVLDTGFKLAFGSPLLLFKDREARNVLAWVVTYRFKRRFLGISGLTIIKSNSGIVVYRKYLPDLVTNLFNEGIYSMTDSVLFCRKNAMSYSTYQFVRDIIKERDNSLGANRLFLNGILRNKSLGSKESVVRHMVLDVYEDVVNNKLDTGLEVSDEIFQWAHLRAGLVVNPRVCEHQRLLWAFFGTREGRELLKYFK